MLYCRSIIHISGTKMILPGFRERRNLLQLVRHTTSRWSRLEIDVTDTYFEQLCDCSYPSLRRLIFSDEGDEPALPFIENRGMDGLVKLTMRTWGTMDLQWERIRTATLCSSAFNQLPRMLSLEVLYIDDTFDDHDWRREEPPVPYVIPNLHTIGFLSRTDVLDIDFPLSYFAIPALRTLEMKFDITYGLNEEDLEEEQHIGSDQLRNLTHLSIEITTLSTRDDILTLFHRTTNVTSLSLVWVDSCIDVLEDIGNYLLPKLTHLRLPLSRVRAMPETFLRMMERRGPTNDTAPLEEITFVRSGKEDENNTVEKLQRISLWTLGMYKRWSELRKTVVVRYVESL